ncbi:ECF transporter S component [Leptotrichia sp. OH3620_COT-345]|uniref:ECF transporter S component n=1 Tax=Leptotrichia sp. OH3620_COT-345 TaxID=2491048 RepID=UPI000F6474AA|nr:ECF transporter S component [Leptotrichia sp. OH3620_COT-345]RRD38882.1 ECF transporter S component [Leptotrichia sp. OH3620_COT-345]
MKSIKEDFSLMSILLIPVAVAINMAGFGLVKLLNLPIFLDTVGTVFISFLAGPWIGAIAAILTSVVSGIFDPVYLAYIPTSVGLALTAGFLTRFKFGNNIIKIAISSLVLTIIAVVISAPITVIVFGGVTGNMTSSITALFLASGQQIWSAVISSSIITEFADKLVTVIICILILGSMSSRYLIKFKYGEKYINKSKN